MPSVLRISREFADTAPNRKAESIQPKKKKLKTSRPGAQDTAWGLNQTESEQQHSARMESLNLAVPVDATDMAGA